MKTVDLELRPVFHWTASRVRAHVLLCMLTYYLEWHMRRSLAPMRSRAKPVARKPQTSRQAGDIGADRSVPAMSWSSTASGARTAPHVEVDDPAAGGAERAEALVHQLGLCGIAVCLGQGSHREEWHKSRPVGQGNGRRTSSAICRDRDGSWYARRRSRASRPAWRPMQSRRWR